MLRIYIGFQAIKFYCFLSSFSFSSSSSSPSSSILLFFLLLLLISIVFPPPPPHFYCFSSSSSSSFLLFFLLLLLLLISIVFPPPPPPPQFYCFSSSSSSLYSFLSFAHSFQLPTAILSSFCSNVSRTKQQSWFSPAVGCLPCLSAPVSFKDSYSTTTTCTSPSLLQYTYETYSHPRRK